MADDVPTRRIKRAQETRIALALIADDPSPQNIAALHRLHAAHEREDGKLASAAKAEARADALFKPDNTI